MKPGEVDRFGCEAVLFDLDGVLVDSTASIERTWRIWAERHGLDAAKIVEFAHGRRSEETLRSFASHLDADSEARELEMIELEDAANVLKVEGASDLLTAFPPESWAIVTSGTRAIATARMRHTGLPIPRVVVSAEDVENGKPDPECYMKAAERLGISPENCVVVEDAPPGIRAARSAGMAVVAVATTHPASELSDANAVAKALSNISLGENGTTADGRLRLALHVRGG
jgi:mannitol-1-/sugar-/sorbitol-6-phosphatase